MFPHLKREPPPPTPPKKMTMSTASLQLLRDLAPTEEERMRMPLAKGHVTTSMVKKKLNFDESFSFGSPKLPRQERQLAEYQAEIDTLKRKLELKSEELESVSLRNQELNAGHNELRSKINELRQQLLEKEDELRQNMSIQETSAILDRSQTESLREAACKLANWFNVAMEQLRAAEKILRENRLWKKENKRQLVLAQRVTPIDMSEEDIVGLAQGSVQDYPGLDGLNDEDEDDEEEEVELRRSNVSVMQPERPSFRIPSPILETTSSTSYDFDKDEKVQKLAHENSILLDKLRLNNARAQRALLFEEKNRDLEQKVKLLEKNLDTAMAEASALRAAYANGMFTKLADGDAHAKALDFTDRVKKMELKNKELQQAKNDAERLYQISEEKCRHLQISLENRETSIETLTHQLEQANHKQTSVRMEISGFVEAKKRLEEELELEREKIADLERRLAESIASAALSLPAAQLPPTDAGNTTQIFHMARNPLHEAHERMMEEERSRKRKASASAEEDNEAKRAREEEVEQLTQRLHKAEKERSTTQQIHDDTLRRMKKYREMVTVITGCHLKVTNFEEGLIVVNSLYDPSKKNFAFKYHDNEGTVDLLDLGTDTPSQAEMSWEEDARHYIGERQSVPAFLAAITMKLEADRNLGEDSVVRDV